MQCIYRSGKRGKQDLTPPLQSEMCFSSSCFIWMSDIHDDDVCAEFDTRRLFSHLSAQEVCLEANRTSGCNF